MTKMDQMSIFEGDTTTPLEKPKSREEKVAEYRAAHRAEYNHACRESECRCSPTRQESLIIDSYRNPPID
jgi:hypothetical protein